MQYSISYSGTNGATNVYKHYYSPANGDLVIPNPARRGKIFTGWMSSALGITSPQKEFS